MNDDTIADLKQFITTTVSQQLALFSDELKDEIRKDIKEEISSVRKDVNKLDHKIDDLSESVAEAVSSNSEATDSRLDDHETRITALEANPA